MRGGGRADRPGLARPGKCGWGAGVLLLALALLSGLPGSAAPGDNTAAALEAAGWTESSPGLLSALPPRTVEVRDSGIGGDFVLGPGTKLVWERRWKDAAGFGSTLEIELYSDSANASSQDYRENGASFPVSVTAVYGRDSLPLGAKRRVLDVFASLWRGSRPAGIHLTYALGRVAPVGSMYRLRDEETVFIIGGEDERGKRIAFRADLAADFRAAYGRDPRGPVTRLIVRAGRPSRESGTVKAGVRLTFPGRK